MSHSDVPSDNDYRKQLHRFRASVKEHLSTFYAFGKNTFFIYIREKKLWEVG